MSLTSLYKFRAAELRQKIQLWQQAKPQAITKMGLIINFDAGVVTGFTGITGRIDEVNTNQVAFKGTTAHPSGTEWSVHGTVDRITGSLGRDVVQSKNQHPPDKDELRSDL
jgi:hypothetical protein